MIEKSKLECLEIKTNYYKCLLDNGYDINYLSLKVKDIKKSNSKIEKIDEKISELCGGEVYLSCLQNLVKKDFQFDEKSTKDKYEKKYKEMVDQKNKENNNE